MAIGPGKIDLLEAVATHGSIAAAARSLDMSYRRAWLLLDELNRSLERPAIDTAQGGPRGGGATVTATGEAVIGAYREAERLALLAARPQLARLLRRLRKDPTHDGPL